MKRIKTSPSRNPTSHHDHHHDVDLFSDLPEPILHQIMSLLPTNEATRVSALSKQSYSTWLSFPIFHFDFDSFATSMPYVITHAMFLNFVSDSLRRRGPRLVCDVQRFSLRAPLGRSSEHLNSVLEEVVGFALERNVREFTLICENMAKGIVTRPDLPGAIFSSKSMKTMKLQGLKLKSSASTDEGLISISSPLMEDLSFRECFTSSTDSTTVKISCGKLKALEFEDCKGFERIHVDDVVHTSLESFSFGLTKDSRSDQYRGKIDISSCKSLKSLKLENIHFDYEWFEEQVSELVLLENLSLTSCKELTNILCRRNKNLKIIDLNHCVKLENVEVDSLNLEVFRFYNVNYSKQKCKFNIGGCVNVKDLRLGGEHITDKWVEDNFNAVSGFQFIENLSLENCELLEKIEFNLEHLKIFELISCNNLFAVEIDAPNLVTFAYKGRILPPSCKIILTSFNLDAKLSLTNQFVRDSSYKKLRDFLSYFGHCKTLTLECFAPEDLIIPSKERKTLAFPLCDLKHLKIKFHSDCKLERIVELIDSLLWLAPHPETISISTASAYKILDVKFYYYKPRSTFKDWKDDRPYCCITSPIKCWRHYLTRVEMEKFGKFDETGLQSFFMKNAKAVIFTS